MWVNGFASFSWQNGSFPTVQISVSCLAGQVNSSVRLLARLRSGVSGESGEEVGEEVEGQQRREISHRLEVLLDLGIEGATLDGDDLGCGLGIVGDWRAALGAEESPDGLARAARALVLLDGAVDGQLVLRDNADEGCLAKWSACKHVHVGREQEA